jgi:hypothetical protein
MARCHLAAARVGDEPLDNLGVDGSRLNLLLERLFMANSKLCKP